MKKFDESKLWIGVDLDGTLARDDGWKGIEHIGEPIQPMVDKIKRWRKAGKTVKIFTARAEEPKAIPYIKTWLTGLGFGDLEITNIKDMHMDELWDDKAKRVKKNHGVQESHSFPLWQALSKEADEE